MVTGGKVADAPASRLLPCCRRKTARAFVRTFSRIPLEYRQSLYRANKPIDFVYFIETGVGSLVNTMANAS